MKRCDPCPNPIDFCSCILHPDYILKKKRKDRYSTYDSIKQIVSEIAKDSGLSIEDLTGKSKMQRITRVRTMAIKRCRKNTNATLQEIGDFFNRNHATIIYTLGKGLK